MKIKYVIPPIYKRFFSAQIWDAEVSETRATCDSCIQAPHKYSSQLKCCTFWPFIPNYLVGEILSSTEKKYEIVQATIRKHIKGQKFTLPMGLMAPSEYQVDFKKNKSEIFGKSSDFLCPYYSKESNSCGAWLFRGSVCTSFFCASSFGRSGQSFWHQFENYLSYLEMGISQEVLVYKDFSPRDVNKQIEFLNVEKKKILTADNYKSIWKHFFGQEEEFYIQASEFAKQLPKNQIKEILGYTGIEIQKQLVLSFKKLKPLKSSPRSK